MPRLYSTDLRERALLACERDGGGCAEVARRFRIGVSTLRLWRRQARDEGRRAPRPMGRGPAPLGGRLEALAQLVAERRDATLAEYADMLAARTGERRSAPVICRALKRLGWARKQRRSGLASRTARTWRPPGRRGAPRRPGSTRRGSSSSTRAASTSASSAPTPARRAAGAHGKAPGGHGFGRLQGAPQPASDDAPKGDGHLPCSRWRGPHGATTEYAAALCGPEQGLSD